MGHKARRIAANVAKERILEPYQFELGKRGFYLMDMFAYRL